MPHIIVEYSDSLIVDFKIEALLHDLHENLAGQPTIDKARIKTRAIPLQHCIVGDDDALNEMIHIAVKLMPGRDDALRKTIAESLQKIAYRHVQRHPDCKITAEVMELDKASYCA